MSGSVNRAFIAGRLGKDPDIRQTQGGDSIANMSIATSETWRDKSSGEKVERTEWVRVSVFNPALVKVIENYVKKGTLIYVEGKLQTRKWTDRGGVERMSTEVVIQQYDGKMTILGNPPGGERAPQQQQRPRGGSTGGPAYDDSEIPFAAEWR